MAKTSFKLSDTIPVLDIVRPLLLPGWFNPILGGAP